MGAANHTQTSPRACLATWENFPQRLMSQNKFSVKVNPMTTVETLKRHVSGILSSEYHPHLNSSQNGGLQKAGQ